MIDRHPALIARCANADDVVRVVDFARQRDLQRAKRATIPPRSADHLEELD